MNVVVLKFSLAFNQPLLLSMVKELGIKNLYFIGSETGCPNKEELAQLGCNLFQFSEPDLFNALFKDVDWNAMPPIDRPLLESMSPWESEILRLFERDYQIVNEDDRGWHDEEYHNTKLLMRAQNYSSFYNQVEYSGEEKRRKYYRYLRFWNHFLNENKIDLTLSAFYPHFPYEYILYRMCKLRGIRTVLTSHTPIPGKWLVYDDIEKSAEDLKNLPRISDNADELFNSLSQNAKDEIKRIEEGTQPYYMVKGYLNNLLANDNTDKIIKDNERVRKLRPNAASTRKRKSIFNTVDFALILDKIHFKLRHKSRKHIGALLQGFYESKCEKNPDLNKNFVYLALHYQPEASNSPVGGYYANQILMAEMIAQHLPDGWFLYLKEHPAQQYINRNIDFYNDLAKNPRIKMISKSFDTFKLAQNCRAVSTIAGTVAWESLFTGKPVLLFGASPIMYAPAVFRIKTNDDMANAMKAIEGGAKPEKLDVFNYVKQLDNRTVLAVNDYIQKIQFGYTDQEYVERMTKYYVDYIRNGASYTKLNSAPHTQENNN